MNSILIDLGFITITYYALFIVSAMIVGYFLAIKESTTYHSYTKNQIENIVFYVIIWALIGARLWYVIFSFDYYSSNFFQIFAIWNGGLAIHGGILGGGLYILYYTKKHYFPFLELTDIAVPSLIIGQAIGRWGNFFNQEAHGGETTKEFLSSTLHLPNFIVEGMNVNGIYYHPTFLYESFINVIGFVIIVFLIRPKMRRNYGFITGFYLMWYGVLRIFIEVMRTDALLFFGVKIAIVTSVFFIIIGVSLMYKSTKGKKLKGV